MKLAVLAGNRTLPLFFCREIRKANPLVHLTAIAFKNETPGAIRAYVDTLYWVPPTSLHELLEIFKKETFDQAVMVGQINPLRIFRNRHRWDEDLRRVAGSIADFRPHTIFTSIIREIESYGIIFVNYSVFLQRHLAHEGPHNNVLCDFGALQIQPLLPLIRNIVNLDIGQTVVVKDKTIVAVETIEGTDRTITRAARIAGKGCVVIKCAKQSHDMRFDIPVVGIRTIEVMRAVKAQALLVEAGKVLCIDKEQTARRAEKAGIPLWGIRFA